MDFLITAFDYFLHVDRHLGAFAQDYGVWIYALLFLIVFLETGVVVTPFLPGDSLLFAVGALAAAGVVDLLIILPLLTAAAIIGDNTNYFIGRAVGPRVFTEHSKWLKREHLLRTQRFYEVHGGGAGATLAADGSSATRVHMSNVMNTPVEVIEGIHAQIVSRLLSFCASSERSGSRTVIAVADRRDLPSNHNWKGT